MAKAVVLRVFYNPLGIEGEGMNGLVPPLCDYLNLVLVISEFSIEFVSSWAFQLPHGACENTVLAGFLRSAKWRSEACGTIFYRKLEQRPVFRLWLCVTAFLGFLP